MFATIRLHQKRVYIHLTISLHLYSYFSPFKSSFVWFHLWSSHSIKCLIMSLNMSQVSDECWWGFFLGLSYIILFLQFCLLAFLPLTPLFSFSSFVVHFPGKCMSHTSSTYTFTTCRILHPSDELTSVSARYRFSKVIPQWTHDGVVYSLWGPLLRTPARLSQFLISDDRSEISLHDVHATTLNTQRNPAVWLALAGQVMRRMKWSCIIWLSWPK